MVTWSYRKGRGNLEEELTWSHGVPEPMVRVLVCRLLAHQTSPDRRVGAPPVRGCPYREVESALRQVGLELAENVYAPYIAVRVTVSWKRWCLRMARAVIGLTMSACQEGAWR